MKRLLCLILNGLAALSLLLCVAAVGLWVRSYIVADHLVRDRTTIWASGGNLSITWYDEPRKFVSPHWDTRPPRDLREEFFHDAVVGGHPFHKWGAFVLGEDGDRDDGNHAVLLLLPQWGLCAVSALAPLTWCARPAASPGGTHSYGSEPSWASY